MTVVVIVGVLSALAIPSFSDYIYKSRTTEATEFLGVIRLREEAYRSEFGIYCPTLASTPTDVGALDTKSNLLPNPASTPASTRRETKPFPGSDEWRMLGAHPSGYVRFGYGVVAGDPTNLPTGLGFETRPDFWWVARAVADLDGDDNFVMFEAYSGSRGIFIGEPGTKNPIAKGWE